MNVCKLAIPEIKFCSMHYYCFVEYLFISSVLLIIKRSINITNYLEVGCVTMYFGSIRTQMKRFSVHSLLPMYIAGNSEFPIRFITILNIKPDSGRLFHIHSTFIFKRI